MFVIKRFEIYPLFYVNQLNSKGMQWSKKINLSDKFSSYEDAEDIIDHLKRKQRIPNGELTVVTLDEAREAMDSAELNFTQFKEEIA